MYFTVWIWLRNLHAWKWDIVGEWFIADTQSFLNVRKYHLVLADRKVACDAQKFSAKALKIFNTISLCCGLCIYALVVKFAVYY